MKDLQQQQIISSGSRGKVSRYTLDMPPPAAHISYKQEMVGTQYGWVKIISAEKRWDALRKNCFVLTQCQGCGAVLWKRLSDLQSGHSKGCRQCSTPRQIPKWLERRLMKVKQRCENPNHVAYKDYGGRGIAFKFPSVIEAGKWIIENLGLPDRRLEIDRINNNGNYAPGNIRFVTRSENCGNRRNTVLSRFEQEYWPFSQKLVTEKLSAGKTREQIIVDAENAVKMHRGNWRLISARLDFMTYEMPDSITVLPYRTVSSTTADTEVGSER